MNEEQMQPLTEHLSELRRRIVWIVVSFLVAFIISAIYSLDIYHYIREDLFPNQKIVTLSPGDTLRVYMQISFILSFVFTSPIILYHIWAFVSPGLHERERKAALLYIPVAIGLFLLGLAFGYFVIFPYLVQFIDTLTNLMGLEEAYGVYQTIGFVVSVIFPIALFFELPMVVFFLTRIRLITPALLIKSRRVAYLILVIVAAVITPPDFISNVLVGIPLILLYEISILLSSWLYRRLEKEDQRQEEMMAEEPY